MAMAATRKALLPRVELARLCPLSWFLCTYGSCYVHEVPFSALPLRLHHKEPEVAKEPGPALQVS